MKKAIKFGNERATLFVGHASGTIDTTLLALPVQVADVLNESDGVEVDEVFLDVFGRGCLRFSTTAGEAYVLAAVVDAFSEVYHVDVAICNA